MKKIIFSIVYFACFSVYAQWGMAKKDAVDAVKNRTLIVVLEETKPDLMAKLDDGEKKFYSEDVEGYNNMIKGLFPKYWKWNEKIEFKTRTETEKLVKSKSKEFAYLEHSKFKVNYYNKMSLNATRKLKNGEFMAMGEDYRETAVVVRLTDDNPFGNPVYGIYLPSPFPSMAEMVYGLKQIQLQFKYKSQGLKDIPIMNLFKENAKLLSTKILLLDKEKISLGEDEIKKNYPFPYKLVEKEIWEQAFLNEDTGTATFVFVPRTGGKLSTYVVDTNEGIEVGRTSNDQTTGFGISTAEIDAIKKEITKGTIRKDDLKIIAKQGNKN